MANNHVSSSSVLPIKPEDKEKAQEIIDRITGAAEEEPEYGGDGDITLDNGGVWFAHDESIDMDFMAVVAEALVEELEIDEPFTASWAYGCDKKRVGEFGGGAFVVRRGMDTVWVDAVQMAEMIDRRRADPWQHNELQFARLISEIAASGVEDQTMEDLSTSMDLPRERVEELFQRAESVFEAAKPSLDA